MSYRAVTAFWTIFNISLFAAGVIANVDRIGLIGYNRLATDISSPLTTACGYLSCSWSYRTGGMCMLVKIPATIMGPIVAIDTGQGSGGQA